MLKHTEDPTYILKKIISYLGRALSDKYKKGLTLKACGNNFFNLKICVCLLTLGTDAIYVFTSINIYIYFVVVDIFAHY